MKSSSFGCAARHEWWLATAFHCLLLCYPLGACRSEAPPRIVGGVLPVKRGARAMSADPQHTGGLPGGMRRLAAAHAAAKAHAGQIPWRRLALGVVPEMFVDAEADEVLVRTLSFQGRCFPENWYVLAPKVCASGAGRPPLSSRMLVRLRVLRLSDGRPVGGKDPVPARRIQSDMPADEIVLDFSSRGIIRRVMKGREIIYHVGGGLHRWRAPQGQVVEDARITRDGVGVVIATSRVRSSGFLAGKVTLWRPRHAGVQHGVPLRVRQKGYPRRRSAFLLESMTSPAQGGSDFNARAKPLAGRPLRRPRRMRLAVSVSGGRVALYAFGDLYLFRIQGDRLVVLRRVKDILYVNEHSYFKGGTVAISHDGGKVCFVGRSALARVVDVASGAIRNVPLHFDTVGGVWSHALPRSRFAFARAAFDPKARGVLWLSTFALLARHRQDLSLGRSYELDKGRVVFDPHGVIDPNPEPWSINRFAVTKQRVVILARGRVIVLDKPSMSMRGWIGASSSVDLGSPSAPWFWSQYDR